MIRVNRLPSDPGHSAWNAILPERVPYPPLTEMRTVDVVIIGAGIAGISAARRLKQLQDDTDIALIEARQIAEGPAGRNSGFMIDLPHHLASTNYAGKEAQDKLQTRLNRSAIAFANGAATDYAFADEAIVN